MAYVLCGRFAGSRVVPFDLPDYLVPDAVDQLLVIVVYLSNRYFLDQWAATLPKFAFYLYFVNVVEG